MDQASTASPLHLVIFHFFVRRLIHPRGPKARCYNSAPLAAGRPGKTSSIPRKPQVTVKFAQTLDGRIATATGDSRWISGVESRTLAHRLRAENDAILVGVGTILADDPQLTVRHLPGPDPLRVVVDSRLRTPLESVVLANRPENTIIATTPAAPAARWAAIEARGATLIQVPETDEQVDLGALLTELALRNVRSLLVEGGAAILTSFLRQRLADRLVIFIAPKIIGGGLSAVGDLGIDTMDQALRLAEPSTQLAGQDIVLAARIDWD